MDAYPAWRGNGVIAVHLDDCRQTLWLKVTEDYSMSKEEQTDMFGQSLRNVEIFRSGKWNGDEYSVTDLDLIAASFGKVGYDVPVKLGHSEEVGEPAYGWVESVSRIGDRLVADLRDLPDKIYQAIVDRQFDAVSSEIFLNLERNGEKFPAALKAVALLGAETPAVAGLKPLRDSLRGFSEAELATVRTYAFEKEPIMAEKKIEVKEETNDAEKAEMVSFAAEQAAKIAELEASLLEKDGGSALQVKKLSEEIAELKKDAAAAKALAIAAEIDHKVEAIKIPALRSYASALYGHAYGSTKTLTFTHEDKTSEETAVAVLDKMYEFFNAQSEKMFKEVGVVGSSARGEDAADEDAGVEVDRLVKLALAKGGHKSYTEAMKAVLSDPANTELKRAFAR
jgi:hypothetical protein